MLRLLIEGPGQDPVQLEERSEITVVFCRANDFFHPVIARNVRGIHRRHTLTSQFGINALLLQPCPPGSRPGIKRGRIIKKCPYRLVFRACLIVEI